jgi:ketosteroid isomerase-like protein
MSQENVEIARRWFTFANAYDTDSILELVHPNVECFPGENEPEAAPFRGRDALGKRLRDALVSFDEYQIEVSEYVDLGDYIVIVGRIHARGRASQAQVSIDEVWLKRFRDGKCVEYHECGTMANALEKAAAGLRE